MRYSYLLYLLLFWSTIVWTQEQKESSITIPSLDSSSAKKYAEELLRLQQKKKLFFETSEKQQEEYDQSRLKAIKEAQEKQLKLQELLPPMQSLPSIQKQTFLEQATQVMDAQLQEIIVESDQEQDTIINPDDREQGLNNQFGVKTVYPSDKEVSITLRSDIKRLVGPSQYDSRIELYQLQDDIDWQFYMLVTSTSVGMVIPRDQLHKITEDYYQMDSGNTLRQRFNLCGNIPFSTQPSVGIGTAFITDKTTMMTAAHVMNEPVERYAIVFGFELNNQLGIVDHIIHKTNIFFPKTKLQSLAALDVMTFEVDRPFDRLPLTMGNSRQLAEGHEVYMIGHPAGIPKKITANAGIMDNQHPQYFYTSLDSFRGNSGAPVFDFYNNTVIGVMVSGGLDYTFTGDCYELNICSGGDCPGEKVIRMESIRSGF